MPTHDALDRPPRSEARESWILRTGLSLTVWSLAAVATVLAASGQVEFARWAGITDVRAFAVPAVLELVAVAFLLIGYRRARRGDSAAALWLLAAAVGAFAVYTNVAHTGGRSGLVFGAASAITLILWFVKLRDDYRQFQRQTGQATLPRPKLGALWVVAPRLSLRAWVIATRRRISTVDEATGYAEVWRAVYEDARTARISRRLARRTAWRSVAEVAGGAWAELPRTAEIAAVQVLGRSPTTGAISTPGEARASLPPAGPPGPQAVTNASGQPAAPSMSRADLRHRVVSFLEQHVGSESDLSEEDDPYLAWSVAGALDTSPDEVAPLVRDWRVAREAAAQPASPRMSVTASVNGNVSRDQPAAGADGWH